VTESPFAAIVKAYDVRGECPGQYDPHLARALGAGFAAFAVEESSGSDCPVDRILVARDMRPTGVEMSAAFAEGVRSQGVDVVDLGLCSTDETYFAAGHLDAPAAVFTASHNPSRYNGTKFCLAGARPVGEDSGLPRVRELAEASLAGDLPDADTPGTSSSADVLNAFVDHVCGFVDVASLRPLSIVADTANGMGGLVAPAVFARLPVQLEILFGELDGTFPNHPADPIQPVNQVALRERVVATGADLGLAFDGDADRVVLVDEQGVTLPGSTTTAIIAAAILDARGGGTVIHNLICSKAVPEVIREHGGRPIRSRVGHSFIKKLMSDEGAVFGGEHSAHYYFLDNFRADSGLIASMFILDQLSVTGLPLSELRKPFERYAGSGEINTTVSDPHAIIEHVAEHFSGLDQDRLDGLTVDAGDWWFNLRPSNTEPLLRLNVEAADPAAVAERAAEVQAVIAESDH